MARTAWCSPSQLRSFLQSAGIVDDPPSTEQARLDLQAGIDAAVEWWQRQTGYRPFLADAADSTRGFDLDGSGYISFNAGLVSFTGLTVNASPYTLNQQFRLSPVNAASEGRPYTGIDLIGRFYFRWGWNPSAGASIVQVTGRWGYADVIPADAWLAVEKRAALEVLPQLTALRTGGMRAISFDDFRYEFGGGRGDPSKGGAFAGERTEWEQDCQRALSHYKRIGVA